MDIFGGKQKESAKGFFKKIRLKGIVLGSILKEGL